MKRGHQVLPYSRSGLYASVVRQSLDVNSPSVSTTPPDANNPPLFKESEFDTLFEHAWKP